jgi:hypothetical protein
MDTKQEREFREIQRLASRRRTRVIALKDGTCGWFPGGSRPADQPGMSYKTMKRWLLMPAHKRPPLGANGQPEWGKRPARVRRGG